MRIVGESFIQSQPPPQSPFFSGASGCGCGLLGSRPLQLLVSQSFSTLRPGVTKSLKSASRATPWECFASDTLPVNGCSSVCGGERSQPLSQFLKANCAARARMAKVVMMVFSWSAPLCSLVYQERRQRQSLKNLPGEFTQKNFNIIICFLSDSCL